MGEDFHFEDFTEQSYRGIVSQAVATWAFEPFGTASGDRHALWRHDVDFSPHRALALAEIEAGEGAKATYFLRIRGAFYNVLEPAVLAVIARIAANGHWFGLHFDPVDPAAAGGLEDLTEAIDRDRRILSEAISQPIDAVSFHNPTTWAAESVEADEVAGMVNAYGARIKERYEYVSDSNGYWRNRRLPEVVEAAEDERLHVLTHPEWWQETAMSPRERMARCIEGRAEHARRSYEDPVREWGRAIVE